MSFLSHGYSVSSPSRRKPESAHDNEQSLSLNLANLENYRAREAEKARSKELCSKGLLGAKKRACVAGMRQNSAWKGLRIGKPAAKRRKGRGRSLNYDKVERISSNQESPPPPEMPPPPSTSSRPAPLPVSVETESRGDANAASISESDECIDADNVENFAMNRSNDDGGRDDGQTLSKATATTTTMTKATTTTAMALHVTYAPPASAASTVNAAVEQTADCHDQGESNDAPSNSDAAGPGRIEVVEEGTAYNNEDNGTPSPLYKGKKNVSKSKITGNFVKANLKSSGSSRMTRRVNKKNRFKRTDKGEWNNKRVRNVRDAGVDIIDDLLDGKYKSQGRASEEDNGAASTTTASSSSSNAVRCTRHGRSCKLVTVKKSGKNRGRKFYACCMPRGEQCDFFMWENEGVASIANLIGKGRDGYVARKIEEWKRRFSNMTISELMSRYGCRIKGSGSGMRKAAIIERLVEWVSREIERGLGNLGSGESKAENEATSEKLESGEKEVGNGVVPSGTCDAADSGDPGGSDDSEDSQEDSDSDDSLVIEGCGDDLVLRNPRKTSVSSDAREAPSGVKDPKLVLEEEFGHQQFRPGQAWASECYRTKSWLDFLRPPQPSSCKSTIKIHLTHTATQLIVF